MKNHATGETFTPILDILNVRGHRYTRQVKAQCAELTSKLSYDDTREEYHRLTGVWIPKSTIHGFTQQIAPDMLMANLNPAAPNQPQRPVILADGIEVRSIQKGEFNQVRVVIGVDGGSKQLLNLTVSQPYQSIPKEGILISNGEPTLKHQAPWRHQLCILHAIKRLTYALWREHASKCGSQGHFANSLVEVDLGWGFVVWASVRFLVVVFSEAFHVIESWIVELEGLPEAFDLALRCRFSTGTDSTMRRLFFVVSGRGLRRC